MPQMALPIMPARFSVLFLATSAGSELLAHTLLPRSITASICRIKTLMKIQAFQTPISKTGTSDIFSPYDLGIPIHLGVLFIYSR